MNIFSFRFNRGFFAAALLLSTLSLSRATILLATNSPCDCTPYVIDFKVNYASVFYDNDGPGLFSRDTVHDNPGVHHKSNWEISTPDSRSLTDDEIKSINNGGPWTGQSIQRTRYFSDGAYSPETSNSPADGSIYYGYHSKSIELKLTAYLTDHTEVVVTNTVTLEYTNDCGFFPVLQAGQRVGWFKLDSVSQPWDVRRCPAFDPNASFCTPSQYEFEFDFSLACNNTNLGTNTEEFDDTPSCSITSRDDSKPVKVTHFSVYYEEMGSYLSSESYYSTFEDGDKFILNALPSDRISFVLHGNNEAGDTVNNDVSFFLTNIHSGNQPPNEAETIGWLKMNEYGPPNPLLCSAYGKCVNDAYFMRNGNKNRKCEWVAKNPGARCQKDDGEVALACPAVCNPQCIFECANDSTFYRNMDEKKDCDWVADKPSVRCELDDEVASACPAVCNPQCKCANSPDFLFNDKEGKDCDWVALNPDERCNMKSKSILSVADACPLVCNSECSTGNLRG